MKKNFLKKSMIILFWLCVWQLAAVSTHNHILLVGPLESGKAFLENITRADFLQIVIYSFGRIGLGFFLALFIGVFFGVLSYRFPFLEAVLEPVMTTVKSIPVASFVVLLLIWFGSDRLSFFISFIIVMPNIYVNTIAGLKSTDRQLLEMAEVFHVNGWNRFCFIYRPALMPYLLSSLKTSLGMSWKSGVAAEVIGMPEYSLGERLYMSKIYLDTAGVFAWTFLVILLSFLFEKTVLYLAKRFAEWKPCPRFNGETGISDGSRKIFVRNIEKRYGGQQVLNNFSLTMETGQRYCLMAPSGSGKTTLLRLINRIEQADEGVIEGVPAYIGMVFQEDRLCEDYDALTNIMLTGRGPDDSRERGRKKEERKEYIRQEALRILPKDCLEKPVRELSGGMKRRCAVLRAMLSEADILIMDEPFTGLDDENRRRTAGYIRENLGERILLITTHREADVALLDGIRVEL